MVSVSALSVAVSVSVVVPLPVGLHPMDLGAWQCALRSTAPGLPPHVRLDCHPGLPPSGSWTASSPTPSAPTRERTRRPGSPGGARAGRGSGVPGRGRSGRFAHPAASF